MSQNQQAGRGALFKNDKQGVEKRPDYTGTLKIWDKDFVVSAWIQESKNGVKYLGLAINEKRSQNAASGDTQQPAPSDNKAPAQSAPVDDDIPF